MSARVGTRPAKITKQTEARPMSEEAPTTRKLAAILSADIKGYSRLMGDDEEGTLHALTTYRDVIANVIAQHRGRVVNCVGDNVLAEFASAVDAVQGAWAIQETLKARNAPLPTARRMELRIGINVGDVLVQDDQLYGDGVNVAARMEALADAGGVCITGTVYDQVHNKVPLHYEYIGEQMVKNIAHPVRVYRVQMAVDAGQEIPLDQPEQMLCFPPFQLDVSNGCLWRGKKRIPVMPKDFAVLHALVTHAGHVVTHQELFAAVWSDTIVSHGVLKVCLRRLRRALDDTTTRPRFIETLHRRGYRFLPTVTSVPPVSSSKFQVPSQGTSKSNRATTRDAEKPETRNQKLETVLVGRETELAQLHDWLGRALHGERQMVFVTGEPGIGKTTLLEAFVSEVQDQEKNQKSKCKSQKSKVEDLAPSTQHLAPGERLWWGWGQSIEHYGPGEPYLPILDALGRLCRASGGEQLVTLLKQHAPTWLVQMSAVLDATELDTLQRATAGATRERMLRELAEALEVLTVERPLVLVLEDLHWSDLSTLDLLAFIARRKETARLFIVGTYRPVEMLVEQHPLKRLSDELYGHQWAHELRVTLLSESAVGDYLVQRFPQSVFPTRLEYVLYQRTGGNPLFLSTMVQELVQREVLTQANGDAWSIQRDLMELEAWVPESVRHVLARQRERLATDEQRVLEAASVAGVEFSVAAVAAALETEVTAVEEQCGRLAEQQQFLRQAGISEWPDGTRASRYGFQHALYQEFWHERVSVGHQQQWHLRMGDRKEAAWGTRCREIAVELALHFEQGRDYQRAVQYLQQAGENAVRRSANQEAITHLTRELELLQALPDTPERSQQELRLLRPLGPALISMKGFAAPEVEHTYARASALCQQGGSPHQLIYVLQGLQVFHLVRGEVRKARDLAEHRWRLAQHIATPTALMTGHAFLVEPLYYLGELTTAREHLEQAWARYNPQEHNLDVLHHWIEPGVGLLVHLALTSWLLGYPDQAQQRLAEGLALAKRQSHPFSLASALGIACAFPTLRQEWQLVRERAEEVMRLSTEHGFPDRLAHGTALRGRALVGLGQVDEGIAQIQQGLAFFGATGAELARVDHLQSLAAAYGTAGRVEDGLAVLAEALAVVDTTEIRVNEAELYRLKGELTLQQFKVQGSKFKVEKGPRSKVQSPGSSKTKSQILNPKSQTEAEACFHKAIEIARTQSAKSWELRATMSLARHWQQQGKLHEAHSLLSEVYNWFTEGFDTKDLQKAKALIDSLGFQRV